MRTFFIAVSIQYLYWPANYYFLVRVGTLVGSEPIKTDHVFFSDSVSFLSFTVSDFAVVDVETLHAFGTQVAAATDQEAEVYHIYRTPFLQENAAAALLKQVSGLWLFYRINCLASHRTIDSIVHSRKCIHFPAGVGFVSKYRFRRRFLQISSA